jgi:hypothetical protein
MLMKEENNAIVHSKVMMAYARLHGFQAEVHENLTIRQLEEFVDNGRTTVKVSLLLFPFPFSYLLLLLLSSVFFPTPLKLDSHSRGTPPMVCLQAWSEDSDGLTWRERWEDGHYVVVIGYDNENLYFMDPSTLSLYV